MAQPGDCGSVPGTELDAERKGAADECLAQFVDHLLQPIEVLFGGEEQSVPHSPAGKEAKLVTKSESDGGAEGAPRHRNAARPQASSGSGTTEPSGAESWNAESRGVESDASGSAAIGDCLATYRTSGADRSGGAGAKR
jgi:hypothetical protein